MANQRQRNSTAAARKAHAKKAAAASKTATVETAETAKATGEQIKDNVIHMADRVKSTVRTAVTGPGVAGAPANAITVSMREYIKLGGGRNVLRGGLYSFVAGLLIAQAFVELAKPVTLPEETEEETGDAAA